MMPRTCDISSTPKHKAFHQPVNKDSRMAADIKTRAYAVTEVNGGKLVALVTAQNNVQVFAHMARVAYVVEPATQEQMYEAGQSGVKLEKVSALAEASAPAPAATPEATA
jgi:hypothetical protein